MTNDSSTDLTQPQVHLALFNQVNSPLAQYGSNVTSQTGEDGIIARIVELIRPNHKFCVEFGAWDGKLYSNCNNLVTNNGWQGVMIEANPEKFVELQQTYAGNKRVACVNKFVNFDGPDTLDAILSALSAPEDPALISIDVDGTDYYIFESLINHKPEIVIIEFNPTVPNDVSFIQAKDPSVHQGCSLLALVLLGQKKGYELAGCTVFNAFFVRKDKYPLLGIENNFIGNIYRPFYDGRIFQGYDGTIHVIGMDTLLWQGDLPLCSEDFQVLPKSARVFVEKEAK